MPFAARHLNPKPMDAKQFFDLTARVRDAQKAYFALPSHAYSQKQDALKQSKRLEAELDREIKRVRDILAREKYQRESPTFPGFNTDLLNRQ